MNNTNAPLALKRPAIIIIESFLAFVVSTFCMAFFFSHLSPGWLISGLFLIALYVFVLAGIGIHLAKNLSIAVIMLLIPIIPLTALLLIIALIPLLEKL